MQTRRTKIVATIGPATAETDALITLLEAGIDVARINCSHSSAEGIRQGISRIRRSAMQLNRHVAILLDLQGPKIRTGPGEPIKLEVGDTLTVKMDPELSATEKTVGTTWPSMVGDVKKGERVLFADGALSGNVAAVHEDAVDITIDVGGMLGSHKGINLPQSAINAPALTEKDRADLEVGLAAGVDWVALSFVRNRRDVEVLREAMAKHGAEDTPVVAKIEKPQAVENIDEILEVVDGIMVARGDLGVEMPLEQVPIIQKKLIKAANRAGKPVITATQMLERPPTWPTPSSMEQTPSCCPEKRAWESTPSRRCGSWTSSQETWRRADCLSPETSARLMHSPDLATLWPAVLPWLCKSRIDRSLSSPGRVARRYSRQRRA
jgi:pyruvate kinase